MIPSDSLRDLYGSTGSTRPIRSVGSTGSTGSNITVLNIPVSKGSIAAHITPKPICREGKQQGPGPRNDVLTTCKAIR